MSAGAERAPGSLRFDARMRRGAFEVEAAFAMGARERLALLGPNGAGKSTLLAAIAGLAPIESGELALGERILDRAGGPRREARRTPPERRRIVLLEQRGLLFPHLSLLDNVAFGPRSAGSARDAARRIAAEWLERVGLAARADARPGQLSGGQRQRVAMARALAAEPELVLLDEPFAALDAEARPRLRSLLWRELERTGTPAILVTHDLADAWPGADRALVLEAGRISWAGPLDALVTEPPTGFTARLAGFAAVVGRWRDGALRLEDGGILRGDPGKGEGLAEGEAALGIFAAADAEIRAEPFEGAAPARVLSAEARGGVLRIDLEHGLAAELPLAAWRQRGGPSAPEPGERLWARPSRMRVIPAEPAAGDDLASHPAR